MRSLGLSFQLRRMPYLLPMFLAAFLGLLPHLTHRMNHGTWLFFGDNDDFYYTMIARAPFFGSWSLRDPFANAAETIGVSYAWGLFVPMARAASLFSSSPAAFLLGWRVLGGALLGAGLWQLLAIILRRGGARFRRLAGNWGIDVFAAVLASIAIVDPGFDQTSVPLARVVQTALQLMHRSALDRPGWYTHLRIVSPLAGVGLLFALLAVLSAPRLSWRSALLGGALLGLLFNVYFFFWTAAAGLLCCLLLIQFLPKLRRWFGAHQRPERLLLVLVVGVLLGLPQLYSDLSHFGDPVIKEALERTPRGISLSLQNPMRWLFLGSPKRWAWCGLIVAAAVRVRALRVPALLGLISFALANSAAVTSLEFENYKWLHAQQMLGYLSCWIWGSYELAGYVRSRAPALRAHRPLLVAALAVATSLALIWIPREHRVAAETAQRAREYDELRGLQPVLAQLDAGVSMVAPAEAVLALPFAASGVLYQDPYSRCSFFSDAELIERHTLSGWVLGENMAQLAQRSALKPRMLGEPRARWADISSLYRRHSTLARPEALNKFRVRYALLPCVAPPTLDTGPWREFGHSGRWCVWERPLR